jgi:hypothetical protein
MATVTVRIAPFEQSIAPGESLAGLYSRGSVLNYTASDFVSVSAVPKAKGAAFVITEVSRGFAADDGSPTITITVKNVGTVADMPDIVHLIVSA